ncbi:MAG: hypothetical protein Q4G70_13780 [Pseudomonadota bacterium]|nr:hypothetical protein [Pseudomonadota bacterium]
MSFDDSGMGVANGLYGLAALFCVQNDDQCGRGWRRMMNDECVICHFESQCVSVSISKP